MAEKPWFVTLAGRVFERGDGQALGATATLATGKKASSADLMLADPRLKLANTLPLPTRNTKIPMNVWAGSGSEPTQIFAGYVSQLRAEEPPGRLTVVATDKLKGARRKQRAKIIGETSIEQLARRIKREQELGSLDLSGADLSELRDLGRVLQHGETDLELLERLCRLAGHTVWMAGDTLTITDDARAPDQSEELFEFRRGVNVRGQARWTITERTRQNTRHIRDYDGEVLSAADEYEADLVAVELARTGVSSVDTGAPSYAKQAQQWSRQALARAKKVFEVSLTTGLEEGLAPRGVVGVRGYGQRFSGLYRIDQITHQLGSASTTTCDLYNGGTD